MATGYTYDSNFKFSGAVSLRANRPIPRRVVLVSPLPIPDGKEAFYIAGSWRYFAPGSVFSENVSIETRLNLLPGEIIDLLDDSGTAHPNYAKIFRAAYPRGNAPDDDIALYFLEKIKTPGNPEGTTNVSTLRETMDHFIAQAYIDVDDKARVLAGLAV